MQAQVLNKDQKNLLPFIKSFSANFYLVGGTAIALHLGHRRSIDFDLFTSTPFDSMKLKSKIKRNYQIDHTFFQGEGELTILINNVKVTFFHYPFDIDCSANFDGYITLPDILTLGAMKVFTLGRRAKWKDYVDLYFIFQKHSFTELIDKTNSIFKSEFNEKLFRTQLSYFEDIDHSEEIEYMQGFEQNKDIIKQYLSNLSVTR